uniref:ATPase 8 n=1 Tax=Terrisswalkerius moritzi TaxID=169915 RepID=Q94VP5_9ANNE|nr:ATPase 8 [Terrisswalkerius moritzi]
MPHLSPMSWLMSILTSWITLMMYASNTWWSNKHMFETMSNQQLKNDELQWQWFLQGGW